MGATNNQIIELLDDIGSKFDIELYNKTQKPFCVGLFPNYAMNVCVTLSLFLFLAKVDGRAFRSKQIVKVFLKEKMKPDAISRYKSKIDNMYLSFVEVSQLCGVNSSKIDSVLSCQEIKELVAGYETVKYDGVCKEIVDDTIEKIAALVKQL